jgi:hypothetical protein
MKYRILDAFSPEQLSKDVQRYLDEGWELYGNMTMAVWSDRVILCQAITEVEESYVNRKSE